MSQMNMHALHEPQSQTLPACDALGELDLLGRMPIPLRRPFRSGVDQVMRQTRRQLDTELRCCCLGGGEWYSPFDTLARARDAGQVPGMLVSTVYQDVLLPGLEQHYQGGSAGLLPEMHPACTAAGIADPAGIFQVFSLIPFVWLVDQRRLRGRQMPRSWEDLLHPQWAGEIVFGGWRPNDRVPYQDYNAYLLLALCEAFGETGLEAFAGNVLHLQHNIRTATQAGSNSRDVGTIAILPWLQAAMSPRRNRVQVVWPEDGALAMPIGFMLQSRAERRLAPLVDYLTGPALGQVLARNCYPSVSARSSGLPEGARLRWPGWDVLRHPDFASRQQTAVEQFFRFADLQREVARCS